MSSRCCTLSTSTWQSKKRQYCESIHQHLGISRPATHNMITHRHLHIRTHTCAHAHTHTHCDRHKCTHTHKHMHDHTTHTTHTHNTTHTHTSTHTHTHTHTLPTPPHPLPHHALPLVLCFAALCFCISWASFAVRKRCDVPIKADEKSGAAVQLIVFIVLFPFWTCMKIRPELTATVDWA